MNPRVHNSRKIRIFFRVSCPKPKYLASNIFEFSYLMKSSMPQKQPAIILRIALKLSLEVSEKSGYVMQSYVCFFKVSFSWVAKNKPRRNRIVKDNQKLFITFYRFYKIQAKRFFNIKKPPFFRRFSKVLNLCPSTWNRKASFLFPKFFQSTNCSRKRNCQASFLCLRWKLQTAQ